MTLPALDGQRETSRLRTLVALALVLVGCGVAMSFQLGGRDTTHTMEYVAVATSQETWLRRHDPTITDPWFAAFDDGAPRVRKPPLLVWLNTLAWLDLDPAAAAPSTLIFRARIVAILLGLVTIAGVFGAGRSVLDLRGAVLAALVAGTTIFLQRQSRTASYDIHVTAWATLGVASALWAIGPFETRPQWGRRIAGWTVCAVMIALGSYTKNPMAAMFVAVPAICAIVLAPQPRRIDAVCLAGATLVGLSAVAPWYLMMGEHFPGTMNTVATEFRQERTVGRQPFYYYVGVFGLVAPWTIWFVAGLAHPFMDYVREDRRRRLVAWSWFVLTVVALSFPAAKQQRYILPALPAAALLIAAVWRDHQSLIDRGEQPPGLGVLAALHWVALLVASLALGVLLADPAAPASWLASFGDTSGLAESLAGIGVMPAVVVTTVLVAIAGAGLYVHRRGRPYAAGGLTGVWALVMFSAVWSGYGGAVSGRQPLRPPAESLRASIGDTPIRILRFETFLRARRLDEIFRIYLGREVRPVRPDGLAAYIAETDGLGYVLAIEDDEDRAALTAAGFEPVDRVQTDRDQHMQLWRAAAQP